jgi:HD-like signal output (HDOD) protein
MKLFGKKRKRNDDDLQQLLNGAELPALPELSLRVLERIRDPESSADAVADALQWDPALVLRVLKTVNTAAYGTARRIEDVRQAACFLGRSQLEQLVLAVVVKSALPAKPAPGFVVDRHWRTASWRAALSRRLAERLHPAQKGESFTIGLLQDMAIPLLANARTDYGPVLEEWHGDCKTSLEGIEEQALGWTHAQVGGMIAESWELPDGLRASIRDHHSLQASDSEVLPAVKLVSLLRETCEADGIDALVERSRSEYGLQPDWIQEAVQVAEQEAEELAKLFS